MGVEQVDGSFKKPGAIPFKWETRPGVPKPDPQPQPPLSYSCNNQGQREEEEGEDYASHSSFPSTPQYLCLTPPPRTRSLRPISRLRSDFPWYDPDPDLGPPLLARPESVSAGSFLSPRLRWKWGWKKLAAKMKPKPKPQPKPESHDHESKSETALARWSILSTRKSLSFSPLRRSPSSLSFSSHRSGSSP